jgi:Transmembrane secretion effector
MSSASLLPGPLHVRRSFQGSSSIYFDDFEVDRTRGKEFLEAMREVRLIHLRNGAFSWRLHEDLNRLNTYRIEVMVPSWTEYLLEQERMTTGEQKIVDKAWAPARRGEPARNAPLSLREPRAPHPPLSDNEAFGNAGGAAQCRPCR